MSRGVWSVLAGGAIVAVAAGVLTARDPQKPRAVADYLIRQPGDESDKTREADREAIRKSAREFTEAFEKRDAKATAALWTEKGEYIDESGDAVTGREAIEKAFADHFKESPKSKIDIRIYSIHFPASDLAVEEGILRSVPGGIGLPTSSEYSTTHVREGGTWKIAISREWGQDRDRLEDLEWLLGTWKNAENGRELVWTFERDANRGIIVGRISQKAGDKVLSSGNMRIAVDPELGQIRSWYFNDDGGHGQALWFRDGNRWNMDSIGVLATGAETTSANILTRVGSDAISMQSIERTVEGESLPNTTPIRLTRAPGSK
jgi:uncharacterized protein (TIGR02246 family)